MPSLLLSATELSRGFDRGPLFEHLNLEVFSGERIGLVGPNGCGKTTLMKTLAFEEEPDRGSVNRHAGARVAMLEQVPRFKPDTTLREEASSALEELLAAQTELEQVAIEVSAPTVTLPNNACTRCWPITGPSLSSTGWKAFCMAWDFPTANWTGRWKPSQADRKTGCFWPDCCCRHPM